MRLGLTLEPFNRGPLSTLWARGTGRSPLLLDRIGSVGLVILAATATLTISSRDPRWSLGYAVGVFLLCCACGIRNLSGAAVRTCDRPHVALAILSLWGFAQWEIGQTVYRFSTLETSIRVAAMAATAWLAAQIFSERSRRLRFLRALAAGGCAVGVVGVLTAFTSPGRVLWLVPAAYPDTWGPFLSRNDFAGFMEISFPVALWLGVKQQGDDPPQRGFVWAAAAIFAAGIASASRAGAILLSLEAFAVLSLLRQKRAALLFLTITPLFVAVTGAGTLLGRFHDPDPLRYRREIARSALHMIAERPWTGFGLGTFVHVHPAFATFDAGARVDHAHNEWLEWAAEGGLPYAAVWLWLAAWAVRSGVGSVWGIGVGVVFLHALVDYPFAKLGLTAWTFALIGALSASEMREGVREVRARIH